MKGPIFKLLTGTVLIVLFLFHVEIIYAASITKNLDEDTKLIPPGYKAIRFLPEFRKGTTVTLNEGGEVLEGTLATDPYLHCVPLQYEVDGRVHFIEYGYVFRDGTKIMFNDKGQVVKGTFSHNTGLFIKVPLNGNSELQLRPLTEISFHPNGIMAKGTLDAYAATYLRPVGWQKIIGFSDKAGYVLFKEWTEIELNDKGEVIKGTLSTDTKLISSSGPKVFEAGTTIEFDNNGVVIKALKPIDRP